MTGARRRGGVHHVAIGVRDLAALRGVLHRRARAAGAAPLAGGATATGDRSVWLRPRRRRVPGARARGRRRASRAPAAAGDASRLPDGRAAHRARDARRLGGAPRPPRASPSSIARLTRSTSPIRRGTGWASRTGPTPRRAPARKREAELAVGHLPARRRRASIAPRANRCSRSRGAPGIEVTTACVGKATCGLCRVKVVGGEAAPVPLQRRRAQAPRQRLLHQQAASLLPGARVGCRRGRAPTSWSSFPAPRARLSLPPGGSRRHLQPWRGRGGREPGRWRRLAGPGAVRGARARRRVPRRAERPRARRSARARSCSPPTSAGARLGGRRAHLALVVRAGRRTATGASIRWGRRRRTGSTPWPTASWSSPTTAPAAGRRRAARSATQLCEDAFVDPTRRHAGAGRGARSPATAAPSTRCSNRATAARRSTGRSTPARPGDLVTGLEIAASDPMTIDLALSRGAAAAPTLARSTDGGASWALTDLTAALGAGQVRIVAIDPADADRVFLRAIGRQRRRAGDRHAAARSVAVPLSLRDRGAGRFRAHRRRDAAGRRDLRRRARCFTVRSTAARRSRRSPAPRHPGAGRARGDRLRRDRHDAGAVRRGDLDRRGGQLDARDGVRRRGGDRSLREGGLPDRLRGAGGAAAVAGGDVHGRAAAEPIRPTPAPTRRPPDAIVVGPPADAAAPGSTPATSRRPHMMSWRELRDGADRAPAPGRRWSCSGRSVRRRVGLAAALPAAAGGDR